MKFTKWKIILSAAGNYPFNLKQKHICLGLIEMKFNKPKSAIFVGLDFFSSVFDTLYSRVDRIAGIKEQNDMTASCHSTVIVYKYLNLLK